MMIVNDRGLAPLLVAILAFALFLPVGARAETMGSGPSSSSSSSGGSEAEKCGKQGQEYGLSLSSGGMTYCGGAVAQMATCFAKQTEGSHANKDKCGCGNGQDWVECSSHGMQDCGYKKAESSELEKCIKTPGAVLAYKYQGAGDSGSWSENGKNYGHVEFNCSPSDQENDQKFCSVYKTEDPAHRKPWPREKPDACWIPPGADKK